MRDPAETLAAIEAEALAVYARHGLPTRPGHYRRGPRARRWTWLGETLAPEARWTLALAHPPGRGWRFGALEAVGAGDARPEVAEAAQRLADCRRVREGLSGEAGVETVQAALRLGLALAPEDG